tara:strand:- start:661 stop:849 length:189 start_codon:yes stop_codon:yes gene_type:complete
MRLTLEQLDTRIENLEHEIELAHAKRQRLTCAIQVKSEKLKRLNRIRFDTAPRSALREDDKR